MIAYSNNESGQCKMILNRRKKTVVISRMITEMQEGECKACIGCTMFIGHVIRGEKLKTF